MKFWEIAKFSKLKFLQIKVVWNFADLTTFHYIWEYCYYIFWKFGYFSKFYEVNNVCLWSKQLLSSKSWSHVQNFRWFLLVKMVSSTQFWKIGNFSRFYEVFYFIKSWEILLMKSKVVPHKKLPHKKLNWMWQNFRQNFRQIKLSKFYKVQFHKILKIW